MIYTLDDVWLHGCVGMDTVTYKKKLRTEEGIRISKKMVCGGSKRKEKRID